MHQAAVDGEPLDPDQLSFVRSLRVACHQVIDQAAFSPERLAMAIAQTIAEIRRHLVKRRQRANPRVVKRKMSNFGVKRAKAPGLAAADQARGPWLRRILSPLGA